MTAIPPFADNRLDRLLAPDEDPFADVDLDAAARSWGTPLARGGKPEVDQPAPLFVKNASEITAQPVSWLWPERLPLGKLVVVAGEPGVAKSRLCLSIAATVTRGGSWPAGEGRCDSGEVLIANFEDDPADTSVPRLLAEGADLAKIRFLLGVPGENGRRAFDLSRDVERLAAHLGLYPETRLLIVDPISTCLGGTDSHKNAEVRAALHPLAEVGQRFGVCVLAVTHLRKGIEGRALHRVIGSVAFTAAARVAFLVTKDANDETGRRHLCLPLKNNLGDDRTGLSFTTAVVRITPEIEAPRIAWGDGTTTTSADEAISPPEEDRGGREEATEFLLALLADGAVPSKKLKAEAAEAGISWRTVERAKKALKVVARKDGLRGGWAWSLPKTANRDEDRQDIGVTVFGEHGGLREPGEDDE